MKTYKKIIVGLAAAVSVLSLFILMSARTLAADQPFSSSRDWANASYTINDKSKIIVLFPSGSNNTEEIFNNDGSDKNYLAATSQNSVCSGNITFKTGQSLSTKPKISATINVRFAQTPTPSCVDGGNGKYSGSITIANNTTNGGSTPGDTGPTTITYSGDSYTQLSTGTGLNRAYGLSTSVNDCYRGAIIILDKVDSAANAPVKGTVLYTLPAGAGTDLSSQVSNFPNVPLSLASGGNCYYNSTKAQNNNQIVSVKADGTATFVSCSKGGTSCQQTSKNGGGAGSTAPDNSCEANYTGAAREFNWLFCSALRGVDAMFGFIFDTVQDQLRICTGTSSTTGDKCSNNLLSPQVKKSWAVFRDLATALLVIAMLIMVFSQALSFGPFDAYTVRKMLPRLAAAAILIQISWPLFKFAVDLSNDLGQGVQSLMLAPFGGPGKMGFDNLIASAGNWAPGVVVTSATVFTTAVIAFSGLTIFGWVLIALSAIVSVLVGFFVLILRQMLIILCMILAPIALVAFVLPGTQRYWKLWQDNFTKLLLMFPLIMAMIAAGKIFAYVGGNSATGFMGVIIVLIGFVGPLWFLPKTFRWGGQIFGAAAAGVWNGTKQYRNASGKYALGKAKEEREWRSNQRRARLGENTSEHPRFDRLMTGGYNFTRGRRHREEMLNAERAKGRKTIEEEAQNALVGSEYERLDHPNKLNTLRTVAQGERDERTGLDGSNRALQRWAMDQLATFGDWDIISELRDRNQVDERTWQMFVAKNISGIHQNAPHLSPQRTDLSQLGYEEFGQWKDLELSEYRRQFNGNGAQAFVRDVQTGQLVASTDTATQRLNMYTKAKQALADQQVRRRMTAAGIAELEGIVRDAESGRVQIGSPEVSVTTVRDENGRPQPFAYLPADMTTPDASQSLRREILSPQHGQVVARQLAARAADSPADSTDEQVFKTILTEMRNQAVDPATGNLTNPVARDAHNTLVQEYHTRMEARAKEAQRQSFQVGHDASQADAELTAEISHGVEKIDSLDEDLI